jgi:hypothetical protein
MADDQGHLLCVLFLKYKLVAKPQHRLLPCQAGGLPHIFSRFSDARQAAAEFVASAARDGAVLVLAPVRTAADEVALAACGTALLGVHRLGFRDLVTQIASAELNRRQLMPVGRFVREALAARVTAEAIRNRELIRAAVSFCVGLPARARSRKRVEGTERIVCRRTTRFLCGLSGTRASRAGLGIT